MTIKMEQVLAFTDALVTHHNPYENLHAKNVTAFVSGLAEAAGFPAAKLPDLLVAAELHDIGKLLIPEEVLNKPGKLTVEEIAAIHRHSIIGSTAIEALRIDPVIAQAVLEHHERFDGTGYPHGLKGAIICVEARMIAICDSFDALTTDRSYRKALDAERAVDLMRREVSLFDPDLFRLFAEKVLRL